MVTRVLVLGGSGLVGRALMRRLGSGTVGTYAAQPFPGGVRFDATRDTLERVVPLHEFSHAIVLFGVVNPEACAADPVGSRQINVSAVTEVVEALFREGVTPVYTSSEVVFDGEHGPYEETDRPNPLFLYARQKLEVESLFAETSNDHVIARVGRVYGSDAGDGTLFTSHLEQLRENRPIRCAADQVFSPLHVTEAADALARLVERRAYGVFHVAGPRAVSRCEALELALSEFRRRGGVFDAPIETVHVADLPTSEPRPRDVSLRIDRLVETTGIRLRDPADWCAEIADRVLSPMDSDR